MAALATERPRARVAGADVSVDHFIGGRRVASAGTFEDHSPLDWSLLAEVSRGDAEHGPASEPAEAIERAEVIHGVAQLGTERFRRARLDVGEHRNLAGVGHQEVGSGGREPQQPRCDVGDLRPGERGARLWIVTHPGERHPRQLGVGRRGERSTEHLGGQHPGIIASADPSQRSSEFTRA